MQRILTSKVATFFNQKQKFEVNGYRLSAFENSKARLHKFINSSEDFPSIWGKSHFPSTYIIDDKM